MNILQKLFLCFIVIFISISIKSQTPDTVLQADQKAEELYKKILKRNPKSDYANYGLAYLYYSHSNYSKALKYSKLNIGYENDYRADSYLLYGISLDAMGRSREAIEAYSDAIKLFPQNIQLRYNMAFSCYKYRNLKKSITTLDSSVNVSALYIPVHYLRACCLYENENQPNSMLSMFYALMLDKDSTRSASGLAIVKAIIEGKHTQLNVPFYENRLKINSIDDILSFYSSYKISNEKLAEIKPVDFALSIQNYIEKNINDAATDDFYITFYKKLQQSGNLTTFCWYVMRNISNTNVEDWYKQNYQSLKQFAAFLETNLPTK